MDQISELSELRRQVREDLTGLIRGSVHSDPVTAGLYATDGGLRTVEPVAVIAPLTLEDVIATAVYAREIGLPLIPRGAGTSASGGALGRGLVLDFGRYFRQSVDLEPGVMRLQPGVVLEPLNRQLERTGRMFGPDPFHRETRTIGGMIGLDEGGRHELRDGTTGDQLLSAEVVLLGGQVVQLEAVSFPQEELDRRRTDLAAEQHVDPRANYPLWLAQQMTDWPELQTGPERLTGRGPQPAAKNSSAGSLRPEDPYRPTGDWQRVVHRTADGLRIQLPRLAAGSRGALGVVTSATVRTRMIPPVRRSGLALFLRVDDAAQAAIAIAETAPDACDFLDRRWLSLAREADHRYAALIPPQTEAALLVEYTGTEAGEVTERFAAAEKIVRGSGLDLAGWHAGSTAAEVTFLNDLVERGWDWMALLPSSDRARPLPDQIRLPSKSLTMFWHRLQGLLQDCRVPGTVCAHVLTGRVFVFAFCGTDPEAVRELEQLSRLVGQLVRELGGQYGSPWSAVAGGSMMTGASGFVAEQTARTYSRMSGLFYGGLRQSVRIGERRGDSATATAVSPVVTTTAGMTTAGPSAAGSTGAGIVPPGPTGPGSVPSVAAMPLSPESARRILAPGSPGLMASSSGSAENLAAGISADSAGMMSPPKMPPAGVAVPGRIDSSLSAPGLSAPGLADVSPGTGSPASGVFLPGVSLPSVAPHGATSSGPSANGAEANIDPAGLPAETIVPLQLRWSQQGFAQTISECGQCGECRTRSPLQRMCPLFRLDPLEAATPRAKVIAAQLAQQHPALWTSSDLKRVADLCFNCKQCEQECPSKVSVSHLALEAKSAYVAEHGLKGADWFLSRAHSWGELGSALGLFSNWMIQSPVARWWMEKLLGISRLRKLPLFTHRPFLSSIPRSYRQRPPLGGRRKPVIYFVDHYVNYHDPQLGRAFLEVLKQNRIPVYVPPDQQPCGMALISAGDLEGARDQARDNLRILGEWAREGCLIVCTEPTAAVCLQQEYPQLIDHPDVEIVARQTREAGAFLAELDRAGQLSHEWQPLDLTVGYHQPCHLRALEVGMPLYEILQGVPELQIQRLESGCSGMAGTYGLKAENFVNSLQIGWPLIERMRSAELAAGLTECSSCKMQMEQGVTIPTLHPLKLLAAAYGRWPEWKAELSRSRGRLVIS